MRARAGTGIWLEWSAGPLQPQGRGPSKHVRMGGVTDKLEGPSCQIFDDDVFLKGLDEGKGTEHTRAGCGNGQSTIEGFSLLGT